MKLSEIKQVDPKKLKTNPISQKFFRPDTGAHYNKLSADIKKRGVLVPIIAKRDGTILAGHGRALIARVHGISMVPVQYVEDKLSEQQETEIIIKDNLLRRHLDPQHRRQLYNHLYPDFEERVQIKKSELSIKPSEIAEKTGLNPQTVHYDLNRIRREITKQRRETEEISLVNEKEIANYKRACARMLNVAVVEKKETLQECIKITENVLEKLRGIPC